MRLTGPFVRQAFGNRAKQATSALIFGKDVILQTHGQDKYRRTLADVFLLDGINVNHNAGQRRLVLVESEVCARRYGTGGFREGSTRGEKGLWIDPQPGPPWKWRSRNDC